MEKIRIAHLADFHLGGEINEKRELSDRINKSLIVKLSEIINALNLAKVQILLIAGDFYESSSVDSYLLNNIKEIISKYSGRIFISPGNHDYVSLESVYYGDWPKNTHIFLEENIDYVEIKELNTRVYGFGFNKSHINFDNLKNIKGVDNSFINIGVFHGQIDTQKNDYNPISIESIRNSCLDYIALGHIHKRTEIKREGNTYYSYSGNPVGRGFDETGEKGIYLGDISKNRNDLRFYKVAESQFEILTLKLEDFSSQFLISSEIERKLEDLYGVNYKKHYYRLVIQGYRKENENINIEIVKGNLSNLSYIELIDDTRVKVNLDEILIQDNIKGNFVRKVMESKIDEEEREKIIDLGLKAFEGLL